jgi:haloacetate dehalogenase
VFAFHVYFLAQPDDLPERMIGADPDTFFGSFLDNWTKVSGAIPPEVRERYLSACRRPEVIHAICEDYRASAFIDPGHDSADKQVGRQIKVPTLALWQDPGDIPLPFDPATVWSTWAPDLRTQALASGHFIPEEQSEAVVTLLRELLVAAVS